MPKKFRILYSEKIATFNKPKKNDFLHHIKNWIHNTPNEKFIWGTCAGLILLSDEIGMAIFKFQISPLDADDLKVKAFPNLLLSHQRGQESKQNKVLDIL